MLYFNTNVGATLGRLTLPFSPRAKLIGLSILIAGLASLITSAQLDPIAAQVERVIDGDTIRVRHQGKNYTIRLIGVDTPETKHPTKAVQYGARDKHRGKLSRT